VTVKQSIFYCLLQREVTTAWHSRADALQVLLFYVVLSLLPVFVSPAGAPMAAQAPGALWVAAMLALLLSLWRMLAEDDQSGCLVQLMLGTDSMWQWLLSKWLAYCLVQILPLMLVTPVCGLLLHMSWLAIGLLILTFCLALPILLLLGFFFSALLLSCRQKAILLALLLLPMMIPVLLLAIGVVNSAMIGGSIMQPLLLLLGVLCLAFALLPFAIVMALRLYDVRG
jgi:heme exporter protein B